MYIKVVIFTKKMAASHSDAKVPTYVCTYVHIQWNGKNYETHLKLLQRIFLCNVWVWLLVILDSDFYQIL